jgi:hypothetical protein
LKKTENPFKHKKNVLTDRQIAKRKRIRNRWRNSITTYNDTGCLSYRIKNIYV